MRRLRAPDGCPWDREQTHETLRPYLIEEAAEATDAIASGDPRELADELGDVLLQVAFHAVIAEEEGTFSYEDVEDSIVTKLVRRHPHVFGDTRVANSDEVRANWLRIKEEERAERPEPRAASKVPSSLPALMRAAAVAEERGWRAGEPTGPDGGRVEPDPAGIGAALLELAIYASQHGVNPELALRDAVNERLAANEPGPGGGG